MAALRERAVNLLLLEVATRLNREHTSQGPENCPPRYGATASAVNGRKTDGHVLENFRNLFQPYTARARSTSSQAAADSSQRRQLQLLNEGNGTQQKCSSNEIHGPTM